jgi:nucleotide-binding universal stress UspA family protein
LLIQAKSLVPDGVICTTEVRVGKPAVQVLTAMKEQGADMLIIGSGTPSGAALFIGGTADRLLRLCQVPVYVAGHRPPTDIRRVLIPTGLGPGGAHALKVSAGFDAKLVALHMIALPGVMRAYAGDIARLREAMTKQASKEFDAHVQSLQANIDSPIEQILRTNLEMTKADKTILSVAREQEVDLICFALGGRGLTAGLLIGRVSEKVIRALPCPLLALPDRWIEARKQG